MADEPKKDDAPKKSPPKRAKAAPDVAENVGMNMTPMIDIVFQLIIFFMLVTDMSKQELENLQPPRAKKVQEDTNPPKERMVINVLEKGDVKFRGKLFRDLQVLKSRLAEHAARHKDKKNPALSDVALMIRADMRTPFEHVQKILQICGDPAVRIYKVEINAKQQEKND